MAFSIAGLNPLTANISLPIGVFDSGMGGLTVLSALRANMPAEDFVYLGDTARLPYGTKTPSTVRRYAAQATQQLVARGVKALVVACNTASAFALEHLQHEFAPLPVFGVVSPGAQAALNHADDSGVLVLATESTIHGGAYQRALTGSGAVFPVYGRACPLWVTLAEQGPTDITLTEAILAHSLRGFTSNGPHTVLLGCTHFPVFRQALENILAREVAGPVVVVDSAQTTADMVEGALRSSELLHSEQGGKVSREGVTRYLATDGVARFAQIGGYFLGTDITDVELVDL